MLDFYFELMGVSLSRLNIKISNLAQCPKLYKCLKIVVARQKN